MPEKNIELGEKNRAQAIQGLAIAIQPTAPTLRTSVNMVSERTNTPKDKIKKTIRRWINWLLSEQGANSQSQLAPKEETISMLDRDSPNTSTNDEVRRFLVNEGYYIGKPTDLSRLASVIFEATDTYVKNLGQDIDPLNAYPDLDIRNQDSEQGRKSTIYKIFKTATNEPSQNPQRQIACSILRYAAAVDYRVKEPRLQLRDAAEKAIEKVIQQAIKPITAQRSKQQERTSYRLKENISITRKLLADPSSRAEQIMDAAGITVLCHTYQQILQLILKIFFNPRNNTLPSTKINTTRTRNKLFSRTFEAELNQAKTNAVQAEKLWDTIYGLNAIPPEWIRPFEGINAGQTKSLPYFRTLSITVDVPMHRLDGSIVSIPVEIQFRTYKDEEWNITIAPHSEFSSNQTRKVVQRTERPPMQT